MMFSEIKKCLLLAIPLSLAQVAQGATGFVDTVMMGWLGSQTIASGGLGASIFGWEQCDFVRCLKFGC
jgi:MATE family multidrug resistance protein